MMAWLGSVAATPEPSVIVVWRVVVTACEHVICEHVNGLLRT